DDARMIAIAADERAEVFLVPVWVKLLIIVPRFSTGPAIESFVHHDQSESVAEIEQLRRRWVVAGSDSIASHFFQDFDLPLQSTGVDGRAKRPEIVMIADAQERGAFVIQKQTALFRKLDRANAEGYRFFIKSGDGTVGRCLVEGS